MELFYLQLMIISIIILAFTLSYAVYKLVLSRMNTKSSDDEETVTKKDNTFNRPVSAIKPRASARTEAPADTPENTEKETESDDKNEE